MQSCLCGTHLCISSKLRLEVIVLFHLDVAWWQIFPMLAASSHPGRHRAEAK